MKKTIIITGQTYQTSDYSMFRRLYGNREVKSVRVSKIKSSIEKHGYIYNPIVVNENYEIVDGQGRFEALKLLNMPVDYVVATGTGLEECIALNAYLTSWTMKDYIDSYCEMGLDDYILLSQLIDEHPHLKLNTIIQIATGVVGMPNASIKAGTLRINRDRIDEIKADLKVADDIAPIFSRVKGTPTYYMYACIFAHKKGADLRRLFEVLNKSALDPAPNMKIALDIVSDLYNKGLKRSEKRIYLYPLYEMEMTGKYGWYSEKWGNQIITEGV